MAAGLGFKTFTTGEVLTAADVNGYLMQGVLVFASEAARDAAITSPQEGQFAYTKDNNSLWYYTGSAWAASGATGDIEGVTAGVGISGGGTSGTVTITNDMATTITASGDIVVGTGSGTYDNLPIGSTGQVLTADTTVSPYKVKWATAASGGMTQLAAANFPTGVTTFDITSISGAYNNLQLVLRDFDCDNDTNLLMRFNSNTGSNYAQTTITQTAASTAVLTANTYTNFYITDGGVDSTAGENNLIINIFDYANTSTYKTATAFGVFKEDGGAFWNTYYTTMGWTVTSAITSITILNSTGANFDAGSYVLYGVK